MLLKFQFTFTSCLDYNLHSCNRPPLDSQLWAHCVGCVGFLVESTANYGPLVLWAHASTASLSSWKRPLTMGPMVPHGHLEYDAHSILAS